MTALSPDGRALILYHDTEKAAQEIAKFSQKDATKYPQFQASLAKMGRVIGKALTLAPPDIDNPSSGDLWGMLNTGRALRKLGRQRHVPPAALGADGGGRSGSGIFRD